MFKVPFGYYLEMEETKAEKAYLMPLWSQDRYILCFCPHSPKKTSFICIFYPERPTKPELASSRDKKLTDSLFLKQSKATPWKNNHKLN